MLNKNVEVITAKKLLCGVKCKLETAFPNYLWDERRINFVNKLIDLSQSLLNDKSDIKDIEKQLKEINTDFENVKEVW